MTFQAIGLSFWRDLAKHIDQQLKKREFYLVFEDEIERYWPSNIEQTERERQIQDFAKSWVERFHFQYRVWCY